MEAHLIDFSKLTHKTYAASISEAHRRPPTPIGAPGLVWHFAIWPKPEKQPWPPKDCWRYRSSTQQLHQNRFNWRRWNWFLAADMFACRFVENARLSKHVKPVPAADFTKATSHLISPTEFKKFCDVDFPRFLKNPSTDKLRAPERPEDFIRMFRWNGHLTKIRIVFHSEYLTVTAFIDLSKKDETETSATPPINNEAATHFADLELALNCLAEKRDIPGSQQKLCDVVEFTSKRIWQDFEDEFFKDCGPLLNNSAAKPHSDHAFGLNLGSEVFADARGIILLAGEEGLVYRAKKPPGSELKPGDQVSEFEVSESVDQRLTAIDRLKPFVVEWSGGNDIARMLEYTVSSMMNNRAVVITSMGTQNPYGKVQTAEQCRLEKWPDYPNCISNNQHDKGAPKEDAASSLESKPPHERMSYIVLLNGLNGKNAPINRWQVGRLIHKINLVGTLRFFAIRNLSDIRRAGFRLMIASRYLDQISTHRRFDDPSVAKTTRADLNAVFQTLAGVNSSVPYGLSYRISRSRAAVSTIKVLLDDLRVKRIPGWQPYDEFLRRRLFTVFDTIDSVGARIDQVRKNANNVLNQLHMAKLLEYQGAADILVYVGGTYYLSALIMKAFSIKGDADWAVTLPIVFGAFGAISAIKKYRE